jgi:hypothetical protein
MPDPERISSARHQIDGVRRHLLEAAAFSKQLSPDVLEHLAGRLTAGLRLLAGEPPGATPGRYSVPPPAPDSVPPATSRGIP